MSNVVTQIVHCEKPPCACHSCRKATEAADSRRTEIAEILDRLAWIELLASSDDELGNAPEVPA